MKELREINDRIDELRLKNARRQPMRVEEMDELFDLMKRYRELTGGKIPPFPEN